MKKNIPHKTDRAQRGIPVEKSPREVNYVEKELFDSLVSCHNALARYVGAPYSVLPDKATPYPATLGEYGTMVKGFAGYRLDLTPYTGKFKCVRFRGRGNGKKVICGCIIDKEGRVESFKALPDADGWATLPLTEASVALHASVPVRKGKCWWKDVSVKLISGNSMYDKYDYALKGLDDRLFAIERALKAFPLTARSSFTIAMC